MPVVFKLELVFVLLSFELDIGGRRDSLRWPMWRWFIGYSDSFLYGWFLCDTDPVHDISVGLWVLLVFLERGDLDFAPLSHEDIGRLTEHFDRLVNF